MESWAKNKPTRPENQGSEPWRGTAPVPGSCCRRRDFLITSMTTALCGAVMAAGCDGLAAKAEACMRGRTNGMRPRDDLVAGPRERAIAAVKAGDAQTAIEQFDRNGVKTGCNCKVVVYRDKTRTV